MCTLIVVKPDSASLPTSIVGNRDERLDRASARFCYQRGRVTDFWAPKDLEKGGTWIGLNDAGLFVGITNRYSPNGYPMADPTASRGRLPVIALGERTATDATNKVKDALDARKYPGFHLLMVSSDRSDLLIWDGATLRELTPTAPHFVVTERSFTEAGPPNRETLIYEHLRSQKHETENRHLLCRHEANSIDATCVHLDGVNYGTRSATSIELGATLQTTRLWETEGPPCSSPWLEVPLMTENLDDI